MRPSFSVAAVMACAVGVAASAQAAPTLTLSSPDPAVISIGQTIRVNVNLGGLNGGQLEFLAAGVQIDETLFSAPARIQAGPIVPDPELSFVGEASPGFADGIFETLGEGASDRITGNGQFFSFELTALSAGSGEFSLDFGDALRFNPNDPFMPTQPELELGQALTFTIVPEPTGVAMGLIGLFFVAGRRWREGHTR